MGQLQDTQKKSRKDKETVTRENILDYGLNSVVYMHNDRVVKRFDPKDSAYIAFVRFCIKNQSNRYLPKIHDYWKSDSYMFVEMENLDKISNAEFLNFNLEINQLEDDILDDSDYRDSYPNELVDVMVFLIQEREANDYQFDFGTNNIMKRRNNQLVIVDPLTE